MYLLFLFLVTIGCGDASSEANPPVRNIAPTAEAVSAEAASASPEATPGRPVEGPNPEAVSECGLDAPEEERLACDADADCTLLTTNHRNCHGACGVPSHAYNCAFAARLESHCGSSDCDDGSGMGTLDTLGRCAGRGGGGPDLEAVCVAERCVSRTRAHRPRSRFYDVAGAVDAHDVRRAVLRRLRRIEACMTAGSEAVLFVITVSSDGGLEDVSPAGAALREESVVQCVRRQLAEVEFPASSDGEPIRIRHSFAPTVERPGCAP